MFVALLIQNNKINQTIEENFAILSQTLNEYNDIDEIDITIKENYGMEPQIFEEMKYNYTNKKINIIVQINRI